jgi:hypothetical protein
MAAFPSKKGNALPTALARSFGASPEGSTGATTNVGELAGQPLIATSGALFAATPLDEITTTEAQALAPILNKQLDLPINFPEGTAGYGFTSQGMKFIVVEDWLEQGRTAALRLRASKDASSARAAVVNDHRTLAVRREGPDWVIDLPIRPGDGTLVAVQEARP